jgi:pentatricopeptide repeat protein
MLVLSASPVNTCATHPLPFSPSSSLPLRRAPPASSLMPCPPPARRDARAAPEPTAVAFPLQLPHHLPRPRRPLGGCPLAPPAHARGWGPPTAFTFALILSSPSATACCAAQLHTHILKRGLLHCESYSGTSLVGSFGRSGRFDGALKVFGEMAVKSMVT